MKTVSQIATDEYETFFVRVANLQRFQQKLIGLVACGYFALIQHKVNTNCAQATALLCNLFQQLDLRVAQAK